MKKRRLKRRNYKYILLIIILIIISIIYINNKKTSSNYNTQVFEELNEKLKKEVKNKPYSKTLEEITLSHLFIEDYYEEYLKIEYQYRKNRMLSESWQT